MDGIALPQWPAQGMKRSEHLRGMGGVVHLQPWTGQIQQLSHPRGGKTKGPQLQERHVNFYPCHQLLRQSSPVLQHLLYKPISLGVNSIQKTPVQNSWKNI